MRRLCQNCSSDIARGLLILAVLGFFIGGAVGSIMLLTGHSSDLSGPTAYADFHHHHAHHDPAAREASRDCGDAADSSGPDDCAAICVAMKACAAKFLPSDAPITDAVRAAAPIGGVTIFRAEFDPDPLTPPPKAEA